MDSLGEPSTADDLEHVKQNAIISTIELKTYCVGSEKITSARNYMDKAGDVMLSMGYSLIYGPEDISSGDKGRRQHILHNSHHYAEREIKHREQLKMRLIYFFLNL